MKTMTSTSKRAKENNIQYGDLAEFMDFEYLKKACSNLATFSNLVGLLKHLQT
jgi:hypothetical protein